MKCNFLFISFIALLKWATQSLFESELKARFVLNTYCEKGISYFKKGPSKNNEDLKNV